MSIEYQYAQSPHSRGVQCVSELNAIVANRNALLQHRRGHISESRLVFFRLFDGLGLFRDIIASIKRFNSRRKYLVKGFELLT